MTEGAQKVLIIEDDHFFSNILKGRLEKEGYLVFQAFDGEEGLAMARQEAPSLIILDLIMPKVSGFEFLQTVSADPALSRIPVVIASNLGQDIDLEKARALGAVDYYIKAQTPLDDLMQSLKNILTKQVS